jgi:CheY-like chemotaxis protein
MEQIRNTSFGKLAISVREGRTMGARENELQQGQEAEDGSTILVVEDEVLVRMMITDQLRNAGYKVFEAAGADEALDLLAHTTAVKVIFSDVQMPGSMDGVGLVRVVRSKYPGIRILLTSGQFRIDGVDHDGFFPKPHDVTRIIGHIASLFD